MTARRWRRATVVLGSALALLTANPGPASASHGAFAHWLRNGTAVAQVYVEDFTSTRWPVYASQIKWNESCCVGAYYASANTCDHNNTRFHCVPTREGNYGSGWYGLTQYQIGADGHFVRNSMNVYYNNSLATTSSQRRSITCHEQGHVLGLNHNGQTTSCMWGDAQYFPLYPTAHDYDTLRAVYSH